MNMLYVKPIGFIRSEHKKAEDTPIQPVYAEECVGTVELLPEYEEGLTDIEGFSHIILLNWLHKSGTCKMLVKPFLEDVEHGVFATRSPCRPNPISDTRFGPMVHAKLGIASENSGRLVTLVRNEAKRIAQEKGAEYVLIDGSPGIGCPVIASLTAASLALIITEPTVSGDHDLRRIAGLTKRLGIPAMVCVNKWDINPEKTEEIKTFSQSQGLAFAGLMRYDKIATTAQRSEKCIVEYPESAMALEIKQIRNRIIENVSVR